MALSTEQKQKIVNDYQRNPGDTGSPEVQVALLSANIQELTEHFQTHKQDHHSSHAFPHHMIHPNWDTQGSVYLSLFSLRGSMTE